MAAVPWTAAISLIRDRLLGELDLALRRNLRGLAALAIDRAILVSGIGIGALALGREHQAMAGALANRAAVASGMRAAGESRGRNRSRTESRDDESRGERDALEVPLDRGSPSWRPSGLGSPSWRPCRVSAAPRAKVHAWFEFSSCFFVKAIFSLHQQPAPGGNGRHRSCIWREVRWHGRAACHAKVARRCAENGRPRPSSPRLMSGGGSSHCRHLGTALSAPTGCGYNANPKIPAEEAGRGRKLHRRVHHVLRWAVGDRRWLWAAPKSFSGSVRSAAVVAAGREALQMDGTAVDFDRDSARVRGAILAGFRQRTETLAASCSILATAVLPRPCA